MSHSFRMNKNWNKQRTIRVQCIAAMYFESACFCPSISHLLYALSFLLNPLYSDWDCQITESFRLEEILEGSCIRQGQHWVKVRLFRASPAPPKVEIPWSSCTTCFNTTVSSQWISLYPAGTSLGLVCVHCLSSMPYCA